MSNVNIYSGQTRHFWLFTVVRDETSLDQVGDQKKYCCHPYMLVIINSANKTKSFIIKLTQLTQIFDGSIETFIFLFRNFYFKIIKAKCWSWWYQWFVCKKNVHPWKYSHHSILCWSRLSYLIFRSQLNNKHCNRWMTQFAPTFEQHHQPITSSCMRKWNCSLLSVTIIFPGFGPHDAS